jgi:hypothetical protein
MRRTRPVVLALVLAGVALSVPVGAALGSGVQPDGTSPPGPLRIVPAIGGGQPPATPVPTTSPLDRTARHAVGRSEVGRSEVASAPGHETGPRRDDGGVTGADLPGGRTD